MSQSALTDDGVLGTAVPSLFYHDTIDRYRRELIVQALDNSASNRAAAAKALRRHGHT